MRRKTTTEFFLGVVTKIFTPKKIKNGKELKIYRFMFI